MRYRNSRFEIPGRIWPAIATFATLFAAFAIYVHAEKQIDRANEARQRSYVLANQLRQSSDDLTRMARAYVVTGDPVFKEHYQTILDIRDGKTPRPASYFLAYWDLVLANAPLPLKGFEQTAPLLELMRQAGMTDQEFDLLATAKERSDKLTDIEHAAMRLIDTTARDAYAQQESARLMLHDEQYRRAKAAIMMPIDDFFLAMDKRTLTAVQKTERIALGFRLLFLGIAFAAIILLWRAYAALRTTLGGPADEVHAHMLRIGQGDFSTAISVPAGMERSILGDLAKMQDKLRANDVERRQAQEELRIAASAFDSQEAMMITDANSVILRVNRAFTEITGYSAEEAIGQTPRLLQSGRHNADFYRAMWDTITRTGGWQGEIWDRRKSGEEYPKWLTISAVKNEAGQVTHYIGAHFDISERKAAEERINGLAFFDQLTGLPNRTLLFDRLKQVMITGARDRSYGALMFIDLDHFKTLNDTLGHDMGDLLLKHVAQRLATCVRAGDTIARLGGDEFVVMLAGLSTDEREASQQTEAVGEKILTTLNQPYQLAEIAYVSTPSIGATLFLGLQTDIDSLFKQADLAMYRSKEAGRNTLRFFDSAMETAVMKRVALEKALREAIEGQQFVLHYQAQVAGGHQLTGAEALVRWQHPQHGMVSPAEFIPLAEETGLILPLGYWVLETACRQLAAWAARPELAHLTIAVNISAHQFRQKGFVDEVLAILASSGANPQRLKLELTESLLISNVEEIVEKMFALKAKGVGFSLDDFGTGYSSLSYLKRLPLDQLKIDQSFVRDVLSDPNDASIARTIIALGQNLGLGVIAEGVETAEQRDFLAGAGCLACQGYYFSRPLPIADFEQFAQRF